MVLNRISIKTTRLLVVLPLIASLSGCVIAFGDTGGMNSSKEETRNLQKINSLSLGGNYNEIRDEMGTPTFSEAFTAGNAEIRVLFYRTQHQHSDGETTRDETTPLVFKDGKLLGYGQKIYDSIQMK